MNESEPWEKPEVSNNSINVLCKDLELEHIESEIISKL